MFLVEIFSKSRENRNIVKLGIRCTLKLEKATKASATGFFACYFSTYVPHG